MFIIVAVNNAGFFISLKEEKAAEEMIATMNEGVVDMLEYKDDGYIELIFKLLARICDGQHFGLQVAIIDVNFYCFFWYRQGFLCLDSYVNFLSELSSRTAR